MGTLIDANIGTPPWLTSLSLSFSAFKAVVTEFQTRATAIGRLSGVVPS